MDEKIKKEILKTLQDIKDYLNNIENIHLLNIKSYDDIKGLNEIYKYCNKTIKRYSIK